MWVILDHSLSPSLKDYTLFCIWGDMAVPIFLLIQCVHAFMKQQKQVTLKCDKLWGRIIRPFLLIELCLFLLGVTKNLLLGNDLLAFITSFIASGGIGRGSYFPFIYIQFAIIIPFIYPILHRNYHVGGGILLLACILSEFLFCYIDIKELWRILCLRYLFLIFLGYIMANRRVIFNGRTIVLSIISLTMLLFFYYSNVSLEPFFYDNSWKIYRWPSYYYVAVILVYLIFCSYNLFSRFLCECIQIIGKSSYEIFLFQMIVFFFLDGVYYKLHLDQLLCLNFVYCVFAVWICTYPIVKFKNGCGHQ